jgi:hypothetical protein
MMHGGNLKLKASQNLTYMVPKFRMCGALTPQLVSFEDSDLIGCDPLFIFPSHADFPFPKNKVSVPSKFGRTVQLSEKQLELF